MGKIGKTLFWLMLLMAGPAWSQIAVQALVDMNEISMGESLTLTVSVTSQGSVDVREPRIADLRDFELLNTWVSSSVSSKLVQKPQGMVFETIKKVDHNFSLSPLREGKLRIPAVEIVVEGKTYTTDPIDITAYAEGSRPQRPTRPGSRAQRPSPPSLPTLPSVPGFEDDMDEAERLFNQLLQRRLQPRRPDPTTEETLDVNSNQAFFVRVEVDKNEVYEGEQVIANWYIYTRGVIEQLDRLKFPDLKGFWKEDVEAAPNLIFQNTVVNGVPFKKALLASYALFPIKAGNAVIDDYKIKCVVRLPLSGFGNFGLGQAMNYTRTSERVNIRVKPLPPGGKPKSFSGAVGNFNIQAQIEKNEVFVNQPFSFKIRFEGEGNAKLIELPSLDLPAGLELYDTKSDSKFFKDGKSYKEFEVLLIPRQAGELQIPSLSLSYFNPDKNNYEEKWTQAFTLNVLPGRDEESQKSKRLSLGGASEKQGKKYELPPIIAQYNAGGAWAVPVWAWALVYFSIVVGLCIRAYQILAVGQKKKDLKSDLHKRVKAVKGSANKGAYRSVGAEMLNIIYYIVGQMSEQGGAGAELDTLLNLAPVSVRRAFGEELKKHVEYYQMLSFAPDTALGENKKAAQMMSRIQLTVKLLEKAIAQSES